ncbi:ScyD/ScyE family protein [Nocardioides sp. HDW12B]|nr:ScyD/ScyE family protein [Nocardioides sp. HDW12B]QIK66224.1 ScyD/ScyE family protein [Nocardioides sp. HDW12B]
MRRAGLLVATTISAAALVAAGPAGAGIPSEPSAEVLADGLDGPLQLDATDRGVFFSQSNLSGQKQTKLSRLRNNGSVVDLVSLKGGKVEIAGVDTRGDAVAFTLSRFSEDNPVAKLRLLQANGVVRTLADLQAHEERRNPDRNQTYGLQDKPDGCEAPQLDQYTGIVESHPYAVANGANGSWYVADAAANAILKVTRSGAVQTVAVLPPQSAVITQEAVDESEGDLPDCVVGETYDFEPVPTDVQVRGGSLFATLLPGGPEDPSLGARGALVEIDLASGDVDEVASGFAAATNLALAGPNKAYVTELFGGAVTAVNLTTGATTPYAQRELPAAVDVHDGQVFLTEGIFGPGRIVRLGGDLVN